jgi:diguanylate cyclase (GGDEF)-like protein
MQLLSALRHHYWPRVPREIRDELALLRYDRLTRQIPILYVTIIAVVATAMLAAAEDAPWLVGIGIPLFVTLFGLVRLIWWLRIRKLTLTPDQARASIAKLICISGGIAGISSVWCLLSWTMSAPAQQSYYPLFMAMGSLTTAFCLSTIRWAMLVNLTFGILPISTGMMLMGNRMDMIAGAIILIATIFLLRMNLGQHSQLVDLLMLKHQLRDQAHSDPLTGLLNRRALIAVAEDAFADPAARPALALLDLDGFKGVNDRHGHAAGDELLVQIADRMRRVVGPRAALARLGGDEFALFVSDDAADNLSLLADTLLAALVTPFAVGEARIQLGASAGKAAAPGDGDDLTALFAAADAALYAVKHQRSTINADRRQRRRAA